MSNHLENVKNPGDHIKNNRGESPPKRTLSYERIHQSSNPNQIDYSNDPGRQRSQELLEYVADNGGAYGAVQPSSQTDSSSKTNAQIPEVKDSDKKEKQIINPNIEKLQDFYATLKCDKNDKIIDDLVNSYSNKVSKVVSEHISDYKNKLSVETRLEGDTFVKCISTINTKMREIVVDSIYLSSDDKVRSSDMIVAHYLFAMQQFYGIGKLGDKRITSLEEPSIVLEQHHADVLKESLSLPFSSSLPNIADCMDQIPEQLPTMKILRFASVTNKEAIKVLISSRCCPEGKLTPIPKESPWYIRFLKAKGSLGICIARIHKKYYSSSNLRIDVDRTHAKDRFGDIIAHFDHEE